MCTFHCFPHHIGARVVCPAQLPNGQDGTLSIEEIQKGIAESAVEIPADLIEIMSLGDHGSLMALPGCRSVTSVSQGRHTGPIYNINGRRHTHILIWEG